MLAIGEHSPFAPQLAEKQMLIGTKERLLQGLQSKGLCKGFWASALFCLFLILMPKEVLEKMLC